MPYIDVPAAPRETLLTTAEERWDTLLSVRPELASAVDLQRRLISRVISLKESLEGRPLPRLSLPQRYLAAKLTRGVPALAGEPIPLPVPALKETLLRLCAEMAASGAGEAAEHIRSTVERGDLDAGSLLGASLSRNQAAIRTGATHRGLAPDLVWLAAELAVGPYAHVLQVGLFSQSSPHPPFARRSPANDGALADALDDWAYGYCPACGSWPAMAEVVDGHRTLRCSFCAAAWELPTYACVYCGEEGEGFVTAAPDEERKDRRVEVCTTCGGYLKSVDCPALSPFPLLSVGDLDSMDLDMAAMEHGYSRPPAKEFGPSAPER